MSNAKEEPSISSPVGTSMNSQISGAKLEQSGPEAGIEIEQPCPQTSSKLEQQGPGASHGSSILGTLPRINPSTANAYFTKNGRRRTLFVDAEDGRKIVITCILPRKKPPLPEIDYGWGPIEKVFARDDEEFPDFPEWPGDNKPPREDLGTRYPGLKRWDVVDSDDE